MANEAVESIVLVSPTLRVAVLDHADKDWEEVPFAIKFEAAEANAKLMAAAPEMLEALERVAAYLDKEDDQDLVRAVEAAIAKAKGEE